MGEAPVRVRVLAPADVPWATRLVNAEGWAFTEDEVARILRLGGGVVAEDGGARVGVLTLVTHTRLAWIGNVAVRPESRGRGVGARLVDGALALAQERGVDTVGLYSVPKAVTLYERADFRLAGGVTSLTGEAGGRAPAGVQPFSPDRVADVAAFDAKHAGDDRSRMLRILVEEFPDSAFVLEGSTGELRGFAIAKTSAVGAELGPVVARPGDEAALADLYDAALAALPAGEPVEVGVFDSHEAARRLLHTRGFRPAFPAVAMYRGPALREADPFAIGGVAGMEKG